MFRLALIPQAIALCFFFHALQISGVRLFTAIQEENNSPPEDFLHGSAKRILTSLKSNSIEATTFGQESSSQDEAYTAGYYTSSRGPEASYYGLHATMDVYGHELKHGQWSSTTFWVSHYGDSNKSSYNEIQVGWHIRPERYGDSHPHFYTLWTRDGFETGCYNMDCPGFVRVNDAVIAPGDAIHPVSHVPGPIQNITLRVLKDKTSGDWWVYYGFNNIPTGVGYFPKSIFSYLAQKANVMSFGGFVKSTKALPTPPMGSGAFPNGGKGRAASFTDLRFINQDGNSSPITGNLTPLVTDGKCHSITPIDHARCFYGGPGGCVR
ncbi:hypothetical protein CFC21_063324 [Triticum aestivum]|uniref:Neprosin PEP catalytic domain-containing protein n=6 Tax=Triticinae TaxID=1648030 RepID=A0A9R1GZR3_WHEAT|nr:uncharacterized protein LOC109756382 [Aegilops tauschii subsp. strangulata]KAF7055845.1 hypothetical protein CFC21_063324 [Triticum aestivum]